MFWKKKQLQLFINETIFFFWPVHFPVHGRSTMKPSVRLCVVLQCKSSVDCVRLCVWSVCLTVCQHGCLYTHNYAAWIYELALEKAQRFIHTNNEKKFQMAVVHVDLQPEDPSSCAFTRQASPVTYRYSIIAVYVVKFPTQTRLTEPEPKAQTFWQSII